MLENEHPLDLIPAYALDSLDQAETLLVAQHLSDCESCRQELKLYQQLADRLPFALVQAEPPPSLKRNLLSKLSARPSPDEQPAAEARPLSWLQRLTRSLGGAAPAWGLASLAVMALLVASNLFMWRQVSQLRRVEMPIFALQGTGLAPGAAGTIVVSRDGVHGALVVDGLKPLDPGQQYQLWLIRGGARASGGVFSVDEFGYATLYVDAPRPLSSYDSSGITIEPYGGSPAPTGEKVMGGDL